MVPLLFSPEGMTSMVSKKNFKLRLVTAHFASVDFKMSFGPGKIVAFLDVNL